MSDLLRVKKKTNSLSFSAKPIIYEFIGANNSKASNSWFLSGEQLHVKLKSCADKLIRIIWQLKLQLRLPCQQNTSFSLCQKADWFYIHDPSHFVHSDKISPQHLAIQKFNTISKLQNIKNFNKLVSCD